MKYIITALIICFSATVFAQQDFLFGQKQDVKVIIGSDTLMHVWVGVCNSPVFPRIDMNQDRVKDRYVFKRKINFHHLISIDNTV